MQRTNDTHPRRASIDRATHDYEEKLGVARRGKRHTTLDDIKPVDNVQAANAWQANVLTLARNCSIRL